MKIEQVRLVNYRGHRDLTVNFSSRFNVLVGVNGSGKTSLLTAIAQSFAGFTSFMRNAVNPEWLDGQVRLERVNVDGRIRFDRQYPVIVESAGTLLGQSVSWSVTRSSGVSAAQISGNPPGLMWQQGIENANQSGTTILQPPLPVLAFYQANRQWNEVHSDVIAAATHQNARLDAYLNYWNASADWRALQTWTIAKCLERYQTCSETGKTFDEIEDDELALINQALSSAIEDIAGIRYDMRENNLMVAWKGKSAPDLLENLSDGQKTIIGLVGDIARRICLLNPRLGQQVMEATPGIVLIDELDMHLHPKWQRALTLGLQAAFPSVQFIVASHSPQVLSEMRPEQIIVLSGNGSSHPQISYGLDSSSVLQEVMDAPARPVDVQNAVSSLFASLERNQLDNARAQLAELEKLAPGIADLTRARALLKRKEVVGR
ncbi:AAA family ATPase [Paraburkholderia jirisanensis]